ncbi:hypothetical protein GGQ22_03000 [Nocardioides sp. zg-579]|uniref:Uncharacterized protein n=1 Tax=Nocardioides marmotae TaxID=2663857 RepID=A0A6I3IZA9_9ACTN|nr:hypothetical protein [Nocardioides marmotae]MCR6030406.1 hypothetical protein [Gordonia jinghuaiqii]MTB94041.1 hypothetical protein [Nocardioides marmotae]QKE00349.1 hypothetical protein HPC71_04080 [Nocardioides marmotae]
MGKQNTTGTTGRTAAGAVAGVVAGLVLGGFAGGAALAAAGTGAALGPEADKTYKPLPSTIVSVTGDKANGFEIRRYDGSEQFPPTDSEARAECNEYDTEVARVRCRSEVRTWYRDLAEIKRAINYARSQAEGS